MNSRFYIATVLLLILQPSYAQTPYLVSDFNPGEASGFNSNSSGVALGDAYILPIVTADAGEELGLLKNGELSLIADINEGIESSELKYFVAYKGKVYFSAKTTEDEGALWVTDGTSEGTKLIFDPSSSSNFNKAPEGLIVSKNNDLYFTYSGKLFIYEGENVTEIFDGVDFETTSEQKTNNYNHYGEGLAFVSRNSNVTRLYDVNGLEVNELAEVSGGTNFVNFFGLSEVSNGLVFSIDDSFDDDVSGTYGYDAVDDTFGKFSVGSNYAERLHPLEGKKAIGWVRTEGYYIINSVGEEPELLVESSNGIAVQGETMSIASIADNFAFTHMFKRDVFYSDGTANATSIVLESPSFASEFVTTGHHAFIAFGIFNGFDPELHYVNLKTGEISNIYNFNESSVNFETVIPVTVQDNTLYFLNNLDSEIGREMFGLDLDFMITSIDENLVSEPLTIRNYGLYFEVESSRDEPFQAQVLSMNGELLLTLNGETNSRIKLPYLDALFVLSVKTKDMAGAKKLFGF